MKLDDVDAMAEAVMRAQLRKIPVCLACQELGPLAPDQRAGSPQALVRPIGAERPQRGGERPVRRIGVVAGRARG
jgi:hypothetical protein